MPGVLGSCRLLSPPRCCQPAASCSRSSWPIRPVSSAEAGNPACRRLSAPPTRVACYTLRRSSQVIELCSLCRQNNSHRGCSLSALPLPSEGLAPHRAFTVATTAAGQSPSASPDRTGGLPPPSAARLPSGSSAGMEGSTPGAQQPMVGGPAPGFGRGTWPPMQVFSASAAGAPLPSAPPPPPMMVRPAYGTGAWQGCSRAVEASRNVCVLLPQPAKSPTRPPLLPKHHCGSAGATSRPPAAPQAVLPRAGAGFPVPAQASCPARSPPQNTALNSVRAGGAPLPVALRLCALLTPRVLPVAGLQAQGRSGLVFPQQPRPGGHTFPQVRPQMQGSVPMVRVFALQPRCCMPRARQVHALTPKNASCVGGVQRADHPFRLLPRPRTAGHGCTAAAACATARCVPCGAADAAAAAATGRRLARSGERPIRTRSAGSRSQAVYHAAATCAAATWRHGAWRACAAGPVSSRRSAHSHRARQCQHAAARRRSAGRSSRCAQAVHGGSVSGRRGPLLPRASAAVRSCLTSTPLGTLPASAAVELRTSSRSDDAVGARAPSSTVRRRGCCGAFAALNLLISLQCCPVRGCAAGGSCRKLCAGSACASAQACVQPDFTLARLAVAPADVQPPPADLGVQQEAPSSSAAGDAKAYRCVWTAKHSLRAVAQFDEATAP